MDSRRQKFPPASPWAKLVENARFVAEREGRWEAPLAEALEAARLAMASPGLHMLAKIKARGWTRPEDYIQGWAAPRRLDVVFDEAAGVMVLRPKERQAGKKREHVEPDPGPGLFDE